MRPEQTILAFDTSAAHCAAALLVDDRIVDERVEQMAKGQAEHLLPLLNEMLIGAGFDWKSLDGIAVGTGPGNFTGIRIAVAAARGLSLGLNVPAIGIDGLRARAFRMVGPVRAAVSAPRGELYVQDFDSEIPVSAARICKADEAWPVAAVDGHRLRIPVGDGWPAPPTGRDDLWIGLGTVGAYVCAIAHIAFREWSSIPRPRPAPFYLRGADAAPSADPPPRILP